MRHTVGTSKPVLGASSLRPKQIMDLDAGERVVQLDIDVWKRLKGSMPPKSSC